MPDKKSGPHLKGGESPQQPSADGMPVREFARLIRVDDKTIRKAIRAGRIVKSLGKNAKGQDCIVDVEGAKAEFESTSRTGKGLRTGGPQVPAKVHEAPPVDALVPKVHDDPPSSGDDEAPDSLFGPMSLTIAQTIATQERARKLRLENDVTEGRLLSVDIAQKEAFEAQRIIREAILNLPARLAGELAAEPDPARVYSRLDAALREALNATADALLAAVNA